MRKMLAIGLLCCLTPAFAGTGETGVAAIQPLWIQMLMLFAIVLLGITSRQISRIR
ncbi:MAG: hypothetical protein ABJF23_06290 [Bryobacteraceae bacterium]